MLVLTEILHSSLCSVQVWDAYVRRTTE